MALMGRCLIDIKETVREKLKNLGATKDGITYDDVLTNLMKEHADAGFGTYEKELIPKKRS